MKRIFRTGTGIRPHTFALRVLNFDNWIVSYLNPNKTGLLKLVERNHFRLSEPPKNVHGWGYTHTILKSRRTDL